MAPARIRQAEAEQAVLRLLAGHRDELALEHREIGDPQHTWLVRLQEHHILSRPMQGAPLLNAALQGALAPVPLLIRKDLLQVQQQRLGSSCDAFSSIGISTLSHTSATGSLDALGATHRDPHRISSDLLAQASGPFSHVLLLDPQRQRGGHCGAPDRDRSPVVAS